MTQFEDLSDDQKKLNWLLGLEKETLADMAYQQSKIIAKLQKAANVQAVPDTIGGLSLDAKETLHGMIDYCLENGIAMGMDEGFNYSSDGAKHEFRIEIESLRDTLTAAPEQNK